MSPLRLVSLAPCTFLASARPVLASGPWHRLLSWLTELTTLVLLPCTKILAPSPLAQGDLTLTFTQKASPSRHPMAFSIPLCHPFLRPSFPSAYDFSYSWSSPTYWDVRMRHCPSQHYVNFPSQDEIGPSWQPGQTAQLFSPWWLIVPLRH